MTRFPLIAAVSLALLSAFACAVGADPEPVQVRPAPTLTAETWVNNAPNSLTGPRGNITVLLFWTRDCINCKRNLGYWNDWAKKYADTDVTIVSIHTPETRFERSPEATARFARQHGLRFPIAIDNDEKIWNAYGIQSWPTEVLIDKQGRIRYEYAGELNWQDSGEYKTVQAQIEKLRREQVARR